MYLENLYGKAGFKGIKQDETEHILIHFMSARPK